MTDDGNDTGDGSENNQSNRAELAAEKSKPRANAGNKDFLSNIKQKSGNKNPNGQEGPTADAQSIPSSVDPKASPNSADSNSSDSNSSSSE